MPNRIIKESICTSDSIDALSLEAERLFFRLIVSCDDYGTLDARMPIIKSKCFPLKSSDITDIQLISWLKELENQDIIYFYENQGRFFLKFTTWEKQQQIRAKKRKYPSPDDENSNLISIDIMCNQVKSFAPVIQSNPIQSESNPNPIPPIVPKGDGDAIPERFKQFWNAYPKKVGKGEAEKKFKKIHPSAELLDTMLKAIETQNKSDQWQKDGGQYIPNPSTWINQKRWEDELASNTKSGLNGGYEGMSFT